MDGIVCIKHGWREMMGDFLRAFVGGVVVIAVVVALYVFGPILGVFILLPFLMLGGGGIFLLIIVIIAVVYFVFVGIFNTSGATSPMRKRETAAYQRRRTNMPPPEPHTADHYDFQMLSSSYHMLQWLADAPYAHICYNIEQLLRQKMVDSRLLDIAATSMPQWQTVAVQEEENGQTVAISRTGMAFEFVLHVSGNGQTHNLTGVYTWAGSHLNRSPAEQCQRVWLDLNGTLADFGGSRMAERLNAAN